MIQTPFELAGISRNTGEHILSTQYKCIMYSKKKELHTAESLLWTVVNLPGNCPVISNIFYHDGVSVIEASFTIARTRK
jgi:hypothetical protein